MTYNVVGEAPPDPTHFTPRPGGTGPWRSLQSCARDAHERARFVVNETIEKMKARGVPTDDRIDWRQDARAKIAAADAARTREEMERELDVALAIVRGGLHPIGEYVHDPDLDAVDVKFRAISKADVLELRAALNAAGQGHETADVLEARKQRACRPFVALSLAGIRGVDDGVSDPIAWEGDRAPDWLLDIIDAAGLLVTVFHACRNFQELSPLRRRGFGSPHPSTSQSSSAANVPANADEHLGAGATQSSPPGVA